MKARIKMIDLTGIEYPFTAEEWEGRIYIKYGSRDCGYFLVKNGKLGHRNIQQKFSAISSAIKKLGLDSENF